MSGKKTQQRNIQHRLRVQEHISAQDEIQQRIRFLVRYAATIPGNRGFVLGISGGQDSTLVGKLAQLACEQIRADGGNAEFVAVRLPYGQQADEADAQRALEFISPDVSLSVQIEEAVDATVASITSATGEPVSDFNKGNVKARQRMIVQYAIAGDRNLLVLGSDHAAEAVTGYYTKFGDGAADLMPLYGLTKSQGKDLLRALGAPARLYEKAPTADLLDDRPGDLDEETLQVSYDAIDRFLTGEDIEGWQRDRIEQLYRSSRHKREHPVTPQVDWWKHD